MAELFDALKRLPVNLALLIVDSCRSGTLTRMKGLKPVDSPRQVELVTGALEGRVVITSSGPDEYSAESDLLRGSFFTHHLLGGLRGPADSSGDGEVTLEEAYAWAWARTVESTFAARGGVQRPQAHVDLRGYGTLVLTKPAQSRSKLVLNAKEPGEWLIASLEPNGPVSLVQKGDGPVEVALAPGNYSVRLRTDEGYREKRVALASEQSQSIDTAEMASGELIRVALKGPTPEARLTAGVGGAMTSGMLQGLPFAAGGEVRLSSALLIPRPARPGGRAAQQQRRRVFAARARGARELDGAVEAVAALARRGPRAWRRGGVSTFVARRLVAQRPRALLRGRGAGALEGWSGPMSLELGGGAGVLAVRKDPGTSAVVRAQGFAGLAFDIL